MIWALLVFAAVVVCFLTHYESPWQEWAAWAICIGAFGFAVWLFRQGAS